MARNLGKHQIKLLAFVGSPNFVLLGADRISASLVKRGLLKPVENDRRFKITPDGLRALADVLERGLI